MKELRTLKYFSESLSAPIYEVFEVFDNSEHFIHSDLLNDLNQIDSEELEEFVKRENIDFHIRDTQNLDISRRCWFLAELLDKKIAEKRLIALVNREKRPLPYNSENLKDVFINDNELVCMSILKINHFGFFYNDFAYRLCPSTGADNSSYWLFLELSRLFLKKGKSFNIRLDPFIEKPLSEYYPMRYKMAVYGKPLDWSRLQTLHSDDFGQFMNEREYGDFVFTDYVWHCAGTELHFTCEELPKLEYCKYRGSRYFHAIFDKSTGNIIHCDGAIRIYNEEELSKRMDVHVRNPEVRKVGARVKIFQTNDILDNEDFTKLITCFFVWNEDVWNYFDK